MTDPHTIKYLNLSLYEAYDKLREHSAHFEMVKKELDYAVRAYFLYGPLNPITITNEHNFWKALRACNFLTSYERDILYCWYRREPERIQTADKNISDYETRGGL